MMHVEYAIHARRDDIVYYLLHTLHPCLVHIAVGINMLNPCHWHTHSIETACFSALGADGVAVRLDVDFVALEGVEGYAQYAELQTIHLYDTVHVQAPRIGINAAVRMTAFMMEAAAARPKRSKTSVNGLMEMFSMFVLSRFGSV